MSMHGKDEVTAALPVLFQKTATGNINYWKCGPRAGGVCTEWGQLGTDSPQKRSYDAIATNVGRANERDPVAQAAFEAEALWKKKKRVKYFDSIEDAQGKVNVKPMLAQVYEKRKDKIQFPVSVQPKLDGFRCFAFLRDGVPHLMSRGGKEYAVGHVASELGTILQTITLDGELYVHGMSLQNIARLVKKPRPESIQLKYNIYDCTYGQEEPWETRLDYLLRMQNMLITPLVHSLWVPTYEAESHERVQQLHDAFVADGYEGAIIRTMDHPYRFGYRSPGLLKYKNFDDKEFPIVDWTTDKDGALMWVVKQEDGFHFPVRPMGTEEQRANILAGADNFIGRELTVRFQGRTDKNIPKFARGLLREEWDK